MHQKDYQSVADALRSAAARIDFELQPGGVFELVGHDDAHRMLDTVAQAMADWFEGRNYYRFNRELFLRACGLDDEAVAPGSERRREAPIAFDSVRVGDCLFFVNSGGHSYAAFAARATPLAVTMERIWDLDQAYLLIPTFKIRRAAWPRHHVVLMDREDHPSPTIAASQKPADSPDATEQAEATEPHDQTTPAANDPAALANLAFADPPAEGHMPASSTEPQRRSGRPRRAK